VTDLVLDASALVFALTTRTAEAAALRGWVAEAQCHAPHLIDAEVGNVLRRRERAGEIPSELALVVLRALPQVVDHRYPHTGRLAEVAWRLRGTVTFYEGLYVALAAALGTALVTSDAGLYRAPDLPCPVNLVP
jgi:predicted nucleic acid-binding protein